MLVSSWNDDCIYLFNKKGLIPTDFTKVLKKIRREYWKLRNTVKDIGLFNRLVIVCLLVHELIEDEINNGIPSERVVNGLISY